MGSTWAWTKLERGIDFYVQAFGLKTGRRFSDNGAQHHNTRHWMPVYLDMVVEDIDAAGERAIAAGATQEKPIVTDRWGKLALMAAPFGHGFCFVQFLNRGYDEIATA